MVDINRLALVRLHNQHVQPLAKSGQGIPQSTTMPVVEETLDSEGDGVILPQSTFTTPAPSRTEGIQRVDTGANPSYSVKVINADTGEELEDLKFGNRQEYDEWFASTNNVQIRFLGDITRSEPSKPAPIVPVTDQQPYTGQKMPERPTTSAEASSFLNELKNNIN